MRNFTKAERISELKERFSSGARLSVRRISQDYQISRRTAQRDIELLQEMNLQLEEDLNGEDPLWFAPPHSRSVQVRYSLNEVTALFLGKRFFDFLENTSFEDGFARAYSKMQSAIANMTDLHTAETLPQKVYLIHEGPKKLKTKSSEVLDECLTALLTEKKLKIGYRNQHGKVERLLLCPYTLTAYKRGLYLVAACAQKDNAVRIYALERITSAAWQKKLPFDYPQDWNPEKYFADAFCIVPGKPEPVLLHFTPQTKRYIQIRAYHPSQKVKTLPNGTVQMKLTVPINFELVNWLLSFGPHVEVLKPEPLRKELAGQLQAALSQYSAEVAPMRDMNTDKVLKDTQTRDLFSELEDW